MDSKVEKGIRKTSGKGEVGWPRGTGSGTT